MYCIKNKIHYQEYCRTRQVVESYKNEASLSYEKEKLVKVSSEK